MNSRSVCVSYTGYFRFGADQGLFDIPKSRVAKLLKVCQHQSKCRDGTSPYRYDDPFKRRPPIQRGPTSS